MPESVPIQYEDLFEFLEDYRAGFSQLQYTIPMQRPLRVGDDVALQVAVPVLEEIITLNARVMAPMGDVAGVQIEPEAGDGMSRLEGFYRFVGSVVEHMLVSGRFQVTGMWASGAAAAVAAPTSRSPEAAPSATGLPAVAGDLRYEGEVTERSLAELFMRLYTEKARGILEISHSKGRRVAYVDKGGVVQWASDPLIQEECLGVLLARAGKVTQDQLRQSLEMMNETGQQQGQCFIDMGLLTFPQLVTALMTQVQIIGRSLLRAPEGTYTFTATDRLPREFVTTPMRAPAFLYSYFRKSLSLKKSQDLEAEAAPHLDQWVTVRRDIPLADLRLKKPEERFIEIVSAKQYRFREIYNVSNLNRAATLLTLLSLMQLDMLSFGTGEARGQQEERWRKQLERKLNAVRDQHPFDVLEIHWTSRSDDVQRAYDSLRQEYEGFARGATLPPDLDAMRREIVERVQAAHDAIHDKAKRIAERKLHYEEQQHDFSAELLARQAEMLMVRNEWGQVVENLERALELRPREAKYKQMLASARSRGGQ